MTKTLIKDGVSPAGPQDTAGAGVGKETAATSSASVPASAPKLGKDPRSKKRIQKWHWVAGAALPITVLVAWHFLTTTGLIPSYQLSTPAAVWEALIDLHQRGALLGHIAISTQRVLLGFTFGAAAGLALGALVGLSPLSRSFLAPSIGALRAVPSLAWVPLLILWLKIGEESKITLIAIGAFFPVYTTLASALRHVDRQLIEVGRTYGLKGLALLRSIYLPAATPPLVSGLRLALAQAWLFLVAAELIASSVGLGFLLTDSQNNGRVDRLLLAIVLLALLGKATDSLVGYGEKRVLRRWA
ncbi:MAG TPA: ABC transporter permease [Actinomycetales bacterium]|nr:ABC transporter permease [Actinomycetales bacterium]